MTIQVKVTNTDTRETAVIAVSQENLDGTNPCPVGQIKGGESIDTYVCHDRRLVVNEVSQ